MRRMGSLLLFGILGACSADEGIPPEIARDPEGKTDISADADVLGEGDATAEVDASVGDLMLSMRRDASVDVSEGTDLSDAGAASASDSGTGLAKPDPQSDMPRDASAGTDPDASARDPDCTPTTCEELDLHCGAASDSCGGTLQCGSCEASLSCSDGDCECRPDRFESDDAPGSVVDRFPDMDDADDRTIVAVGHSLHDGRDIDWIGAHIVDGADGGNPKVTATLSNIPSGARFRLHIYYVCDDGDDESVCAQGTTDNQVGRGCQSGGGATAQEVVLETECDNWSTDDDGQLFIMIESLDEEIMCSEYRIALSVR